MVTIGYGPSDSVWINMDETQIPHHVGGRLGNIHKARSALVFAQLQEKATLAQKRKHTTYMACIANQKEWQEVLPQVLLPNPKGDKKQWKCTTVVTEGPANVKVNVDSSGWVNKKIMQWWLKQLHEVAQSKGNPKIVFVLDCCPSHYARVVLDKIKKYHWKLLLIPAKLTYMLQPLDLYCFAPLKNNCMNIAWPKRSEP